AFEREQLVLALDAARVPGQSAVEGSSIELTPREFALLEYLIRRRDEVVSKAEILEHVWDTFDTDPNVVEVYVGYLRRKIDAPFGRNALQTVRGAGYRLAGDGG
ncbi:winged helix-turn-helix domain-containing protein, partial [Nonomuraea angiospora]|uniref:winged helix-turn-helix domain-containing protein n=1 Tax=Nonomuraea angiospora TaxID=46172 RepID=UPI00344BE6D1